MRDWCRLGIGLLLCAVTAGCAAHARRPDIPRAADEPARRRVFEGYRLTFRSSFWGPRWARPVDGTHDFAALEDVAGAYAESAAIYRRARARARVIGAISGAGLGLIAYTLIGGLTADEEDQLSSDTETALYASGGGLIAAAIAIALVWDDPAHRLADAYNEALARDLAVDAAARPPPAPSRPSTMLRARWRF
jgi:hypothetical protein